MQVATPPTANEFRGGVIGVTLRPVSGADIVSLITDEHLLHHTSVFFQTLLSCDHEIHSSAENPSENQHGVYNHCTRAVVPDFSVWIIFEHSPDMLSMDRVFIGGARAQRGDMCVINDLNRFAGLHAKRKFSVCVHGELKGARVLQDNGNFESGKYV